MYTDMNTVPMSAGRSVKDHIGRFFTAFGRYRRERKDMVRLMAMPDHLLHDVGISRDEAFEARPRPFRHFVR